MAVILDLSVITAVGEEVDILKDTYLESFYSNLKEVWTKAKENIEARKVKEDQVWVRTEGLQGKVNRTEPPWKGP